MPVKNPKIKIQKSKVEEKIEKALKPATAKKATNLSIPAFSLLGKADGTIDLPKEIFGVLVNKALLSQTARVYLNNQKTITASTKTRGQVEGSSAKIYAQKGTGRARHGSVRAPIFVGGGIVFGPTPRKVIMELPKKMKKAALISALSDKAAEKKVLGLTGLDKTTGKTKEIASLLTKLSDKKKKESVLILTDKNTDNVLRAVRNLPTVSVFSVETINAYEVLKHDLLLLTKEAVDKLGKRESSGKNEESSEKVEKAKIKVKTKTGKESSRL